MKHSYGKKTIAAAILISFFAGSMPVYAAALLQTDTLNYIKGYLSSYIPDYFTDINSKTSSTIDQSRQLMNSHIDASTGKAIDDITNYTNGEKSRIDSELNAYTDELLSQMDQVIDEQADEIKDILHDYTDLTIKNSKNQLDSELTNALQQHLLEKPY